MRTATPSKDRPLPFLGDELPSECMAITAPVKFKLPSFPMPTRSASEPNPLGALVKLASNVAITKPTVIPAPPKPRPAPVVYQRPSQSFD